MIRDVLDGVEFMLSDGDIRPAPRSFLVRALIYDEKALIYDETGDWSAAEKARQEARQQQREARPLRPRGALRRGPG